MKKSDSIKLIGCWWAIELWIEVEISLKVRLFMFAEVNAYQPRDIEKFSK